MARTNRLALLAAALLLVLAAGSVLATRAPQPATPPAADHQDGDGNEGAASDAEAVTHALERLAANEITVEDEAAFGELAGQYGLGGAIRLHAWADATGMSVDELAAMRDGDGTQPMGWGQMARELGVHPGIGSIMGRGSAADLPPGHERKAGD